MSVYFGAGTITKNKEGRILLVQEAKPRIKGKWNIPSGQYENNETIKQNAKRETKEETGLKVEIKGLVGIYTRDAETNPDKKYVMPVFETQKTGGKLDVEDNQEIQDARYFKPKEIPELNLRSEITEKIIKDFQKRGSADMPIHHHNIT